MGGSDDQFRSLQAQVQGLKELLTEEIRAKSSLEATLRVQIQKYEDFTDRVPWIVALVDSKLRYIQVNRQFELLQGLREQDLLDRQVGECGESASWSKVVCDFAADPGHGDHQARFELDTPDGARSFLAMMSRSQLDNHITIIAFDQTARLQAVRDAELYAERAMAASEAKSRLLGVISHEVRTPLNGILGMASLLLGTPLEETQQEMARTIESSGSTLQTIVNDILDFANIEAGELTIESSLFSPRKLLDGVLLLFRTQARAKGLLLEISLDPEAPEVVVGDPARIRQVLIGLVGNAIKFTEEGSVRVHGSFGSLLNGEERLRFEVVDTGPGIRPEHIERVFGSFVRGDDSTTRRFGGTGLGLNIAKQLVQAMGGDIEAESGQSHGTCFRFSVPCERVAQEEPNSQSSESVDKCREGSETKARTSSGSSAGQLRPGLHVLVAEDNRVNQKVAEGSLKRLGCQVTCVENGQLAVEAALQEAFDLVLMDVEMPELDGLQATRRLREHLLLSEAPDGKHLPIVALTANAIRGARETCLEAGMDDYMSKPLSLDRLEEVLRTWCA